MKLDFVSARDFCETIFDGTHDSPKEDKFGSHKLITSKNILLGKIDLEDSYCISDKDYKLIQKRSAVHKNDILFSMIGTIGNVCFINEEPTYAIKNMGCFRCKNYDDALWLYIYLQSGIAKAYIEQFINGSIQKFLPLGKLKDFPVLKKNKNTKQICNIFSEIDKQINRNNYMVQKLQVLVKSIYSRWFNQFEFENNEGKFYKSSGGKLIYNELLKREIPLNWTVKKLGDLLNLYQPKTISEAEINNNPGNFAVYGANGVVGHYYKKNHDNPEVTITCRGNTCGNLLMTMPNAWITGNSMVIGMTKKFNYKEYIYHNLLFSDRKKFITGSAQPQITASNLSNYYFLIPEEKVLIKFEKIANFYRRQYVRINELNYKLINLKNRLLTLLINGQLQ